MKKIQSENIKSFKNINIESDVITRYFQSMLTASKVMRI